MVNDLICENCGKAIQEDDLYYKIIPTPFIEKLGSRVEGEELILCESCGNKSRVVRGFDD